MIKSVDYLDGFQYVGGELNFFPHGEGYVNVTLGTTGNRIFNYVYYYTDHLGNIRLTYTKDMVSNQLKIMEENHYYPFGLKHQKYSPAGSLDLKAESADIARPGYVTSTPFMYRYNGKEYQDELGLNMYDMDMRQYDPAIARWVVLDPVIHHSMSPYNAFDNNPVFWADPSGADSVFDQQGVSASSISDMFGNTIASAGGAEGEESQDSQNADAKAQKQMAKALGTLDEMNDAIINGGNGDNPRNPLNNSKYEHLYTGSSTYVKEAIAGAITLAASDTPAIPVGDIIGLGVIAGAIAHQESQRVYVTYTLVNEKGQVYVGRTSGFDTPYNLVMQRYSTHHMKSMGYGTPIVDKAAVGPPGYGAIRGREQQVMDHYGGVGSPNVGNRIRGVGNYNPLGGTYHNASNIYFGNLHEYTGKIPYSL